MSESAMSSSLPRLDAELLLEHARWMRALARRLVADPERADELSQETWLRILQRPPRLDSPFLGWIATVMRNLVRAERRGSDRRATREAACARAEAQPSAHDLVERATLQRELVQTVLELEEPYRTTILLRYFEERTPQEIAGRERIPLATVKTRLARGIARLRERLGRWHAPDGKTSVLLALARLEERAPRLPWTGTKVTAFSLFMNTKLLGSLALVLAAVLVYVLATRGAEPPLTRESAVAAHELAPAPDAAPGTALASSHREAVAPARAPRSEAVPPGSAPAPARVRGRVIDASDTPVASVEIVLSERESSRCGELDLEDASAAVVARASADGEFELAGPCRGRLFVRDPRWTTLLAGLPVDKRSGQECRIVVAPRIALEGVVLDEQGLALAGAEVALEPPATLRASLAQVLDFSSDVPWVSLTDARGRFRLAHAPAIEGGVLRARLEGLVPHEEPAPLHARSDLVLVLLRPGAEDASLRGRVVDAAGMPVPEAQVSHGIDTTRTDEHGRFAFRLDDPESFNRLAPGHGIPVPAGLLRALKPGFLPAALRATRTLDGSLEWPRPIVLRLGSEPLAIAGRVLDSSGEPCPGMRVWIADPTFFGGLVRGSGAGRFPDLVHVESQLAGSGPGWNWTESDREGRFVLRGLMEREYALAAMDPATLQRCELDGVSAGRRDVELVLAREELLPRLAGRVVDGRGQPVPNLVVFPMCDALETRLEGQLVQTQHEEAKGTRTDDVGRFRLERVPERLVYLRIEGADTIPLEWGRGIEGGLAELAGERPEDIVITVERRCHFQVELTVPSEADELGVLDAAGRELVVSEFYGNGRRDTERHPIVEGRSGTLAVGDRAATLVLYRAGAEVRRVALALTPGTPVNLRL